jgi:hypothetical protein
MKKIMIILFVLMFVCVSKGFSHTLGTNITIYDGASHVSNWHSTQEDQEVEPGNSGGQFWDLEGFYIDGTTLNMVGGFDFKNGQGNVQSGDIFVNTLCNGKYGSANMNGNGNQLTPNTYGYNYVFDLSFDNDIYTYTLYGLTPESTLLSVYYERNNISNPFSYVNGGIELGSGVFSYYTGLNDADVGGLLGDTHNIVSLDLYNLILLEPDLDRFDVHFTIGCGNDNLMGSTCNPVPIPASMLLFGSGLIGLVGLGRRKVNKIS